MFMKSVKDTVLQYNMLSDCNKIIVAFSGGADSTALLFSLKKLETELGITVEACHVNHNLRGEESDNDQLFAENFCKKLNLPLHTISVNVKENKKKHQSTEECARDLRYDFFERLAKEHCAKIATAHTASDNAETVLINLTRGTALKGLCGIPPVRDYLIRPLINVTRQQVEEYCEENCLPFVTDKTNFSADYTRNRFRLEIIPEICKINPSFHSGISRMTAALSDDSRFLEKLAQKAKKDAYCDGKYSLEKLSELEKPIIHRVILSVFDDYNIEPSNLRVAMTAEIIKNGHGKVNLSRNKFAIVKRGFFYCEEIFQNYRKINT